MTRDEKLREADQTLKRMVLEQETTTASPPPSNDLQSQLDALKATVEAQAAQIAELQSQLNQKASMTDVTTAIQQGASANSNNVETFTDTFSDPPTEAEMQALVDKLNELINQLRQPT